MATGSFNVSVDISGIEGLADKLGRIDAQALAQASLVAVNGAAAEVYDLVRPRMIKSLNLSDDYLRQRLELNLATDPNRVTARIVALGSKPQMTQLARYDARQLVRAARSPKAKGSAKTGIPAGMRSAGVSVQVLRGDTKTMAGAFLVELKNGNGTGVATRKPGIKGYKVRYGPSVYQMFKYAAEEVVSESEAILEERLIVEAQRVFEESLGSTK